MEKNIRCANSSTKRYPNSFKPRTARCNFDTDVAQQVSRRHKLQDRLNDITSLQDLFIQQSHLVSFLQNEPILLHSHKEYNCFSYNGIVDTRIEATHSRPARDVMNESTGLASGVCDLVSAELLVDTSLTSDSSSDSLHLVGGDEDDDEASFRCEHVHFLDDEDDNDNDKDDDDESFSFDLNDTDSGIHDVIYEIQKEASRIDIIMALNQLDTLQNELHIVTKALHDRSIEAEDLNRQLQDQEDRAACLELERDLFKAEANKLRDDLRKCMESLSSSVALKNHASHEPSLGQRDSLPTTCQNSISQFEVVPPMVVQELRKASLERPRLTSSIKFPPIKSCSHIANSSMAAVKPNKRRHIVPRVYHASDSSMKNIDDVRGIKKLEPNRTDIIFRKTSISTSPLANMPPTKSLSTNNPIDGSQFNEKENRMCGIFRRRRRSSLSSREADMAIMQQQIDRMNNMVKYSMTTSDNLRKRLAMISRYYEGIIRKLEEKLAELKTEKTRMKVDLTNEVSTVNHEKRAALIQIQSTLNQKDQEIANLKTLLSS